MIEEYKEMVEESKKFKNSPRIIDYIDCLVDTEKSYDELKDWCENLRKIAIEKNIVIKTCEYPFEEDVARRKQN